MANEMDIFEHTKPTDIFDPKNFQNLDAFLKAINTGRVLDTPDTRFGSGVSMYLPGIGDAIVMPGDNNYTESSPAGAGNMPGSIIFRDPRNNGLNYNIGLGGSSTAVPDWAKSLQPSNGQTYTMSEYKRDGGFWDIAPVVLSMAATAVGANALGGMLGAGEGAATAGAADVGATAAGDSAFASLPAGGMASTGSIGATTGSALGDLGTGTFGTTTADIGSLMGTTGGVGGLGTGLSGVTAGDLAGSTSLLGGGSLLDSIPSQVKNFATDKLIGAGVNAALGGALGGSLSGSGGNMYVPSNQQATDAAFNANQKAYQNTLDKYFGSVDPYAQNLLASQMNNPQNAALLSGAKAAGTQYGTTAASSGAGSQAMFSNANDLLNAQRQMQGTFNANMPDVQSAATGMFGLADESLARYNKLLDYQQAQQPNVSQASQNLYDTAGRIYQSAFDPRQAIYNQNLQDLTENVRAGEYARGIQSSPYGASVEGESLGRFQNDWVNQQLSRQAQGASAMAGAGQAAQGLTNNYLGTTSGLIGNRNQQYEQLNKAAAGLMGNYLNSQAQNANVMSSAVGREFQGAAGLGSTAAQMYDASGRAPFNAQNDIFNNQSNAIQNYWGSVSPYLTGLGNLQGRDLQYLGYGNQSQNMAFQQNLANRQTAMNAASSLSGPITQAIKGIYGGWGSGNTADWAGNLGDLSQSTGLNVSDIFSGF